MKENGNSELAALAEAVERWLLEMQKHACPGRPLHRTCSDLIESVQKYREALKNG